MPILWKALFGLIPILVLVGIVLVVLMLICVWYGKKRNQKIFNARMKSYLLWFLVIALSLFVYGVVGLGFEMYLVEYIVVTVLALGALSLGEKMGWFAVSNLLWKIVFGAAFLSILLFSYRWVDQTFFSVRGSGEALKQCAYFFIF